MIPAAIVKPLRLLAYFSLLVAAGAAQAQSNPLYVPLGPAKAVLYRPELERNLDTL